MAALGALPAPSSSSSSAASSSNSQENYQVFLSFRGIDTGRNFTDHLYESLKWSGIRAFRDDERIQINREIINAIEESKVSLIVLSKDYASSIRCLDELVMIMEHRRSNRHTVIPIFYDVATSEVAKQTGSFAVAFHRHRQQITKDKVEEWKEALAEVTEIAGKVLENGHQAEFICDIVKMVSEIPNRIVLLVSAFLVGIDSRLQGINSWLKDESVDVGVGMICGIGGVGKTTLAKIAFKLHYEKFDSFSFLGEVRRKAKQDNKGLVKLQRKLLSDILKEKVEEIYNKDEGTAMIRKAIKHRRVLVVLDDVDDNELLVAFIGEWDSLHSKGSKIIITTRQQLLLSPHEIYKEFIIEPLDENESLQLFSLQAFEQEYPTSVDMENSRYVVGHCDALPLALEILGSSLSGDSGLSMDELNRKLDAAEKIEGEEELERTLKISYKSP
ncbi:disease resistance protein RUN1-like [Hevea brasiliensis]|uniref:disease resistance protein RUN1-like n=1 Tax=Hevea brasiliensis TaxID=3981 RepID=UPI0025D7A05C|nr:disease resistance protein RUN1-like [Hevea brasiliensis]